MPSAPISALLAQGQAIWLDYIRRDLIESGELARFVRDEGLRGVTSNPAIFQKAIAGSHDYDGLFAAALRETRDPIAVYERIAVREIQDACDALRPVYESTGGRDGFASLEVSPHLAHDTAGTIAEARKLWAAVARPNVMIKVPGSPAGIPALDMLIGEGINVNVTLLFSREAYRKVAETYIAALERRATHHREFGRVASVASFFVSRIDSAVDKLLETRIQPATSETERARVRDLLGKAAIANAKLAYRIYRELIATPRWQGLAAKGAQPQRVLWASTSTKNPAYRDVLYVEELVGADTVNTLPLETFDAFRDHGRVRPSLTENIAEAEAVMAELGALGISMDEVTAKLLDDGVRLFAESYDKLLAAIGERVRAEVSADA
jgi:transaldolase / glucose-6-phosphate isomerase